MVKKKEIFSHKTSTVSLRESGVVSDVLNGAIKEAIEDNLMTMVETEGFFRDEVKEHFVQDSQIFLQELFDAGYISQWDVICDRRNNSDKEDAKKGIARFAVKYRQWQCLISTLLDYEIRRKPKFKKKKVKGRVIL